MRRTLVFLSLLICAGAAQAVDFEVGAGAAHYVPRGNMMWYQDGFPHTLDLNAPAIEAGLVGNVLERGRFGLDWRVTYVYLGTVRSDAIATDDANYDKVVRGCHGRCTLQNRFHGSGRSQGVKLTLTPTYTWNGWKIGLEAGAFVHQNRWNVAIDFRPYYASYNTTFSYDLHTERKWTVAPVVGLSVGRGPFSVAATYYFNKSRGDDVHTLWQGVAVATIRYRF